MKVFINILILIELIISLNMKGNNTSMNLEFSLVQFLKSGNKLNYDYNEAEPGFVGLHNFEDLKIDVIWIEGTESGKSYYEIEAVSLTCENEYYDPEFILLWLPNEKQYGSWDCDHWILYVFNDTKWEDIEKDPLPFINCQWDPNQNIGKIFDPSKKYEMKKGWPF